jgi:hypothetical protein
MIGKKAEESARAVAGVLRKHGYLRQKPDGSVMGAWPQRSCCCGAGKAKSTTGTRAAIATVSIRQGVR